MQFLNYTTMTHENVSTASGLTEEQKKVILYAYLDLKGSMESPNDHDYDGQKQTIKELEEMFPFVKEA
jgi:hypothetical protein